MPRIDLLVWILVKKLVPLYYIKLAPYLEDTGRFRNLPSWRKDFKKEWRRAAKAYVSEEVNPAYRPDPHSWICTCPYFVTSRFLVCKHLVHAVYPVDNIFFLEASRNRTIPFWSHPSLRSLETCGDSDDEDDGSHSRSLGALTTFRCAADELDDESDDDNDTLGAFVDMGGDVGRTFQERFGEIVTLLRDFTDGLDYQVQFGDERMLRNVEREGLVFLRFARNCLSREHRLVSTRTTAPTTWEASTSNAMFYRARPRPADRLT